MLGTVKKSLSASTALLLAVLCVIPAQAKSYIVDTGGEKYEVLDNNTLAFAGYEGTYGKVVIPDAYYSKPVVSVNSMAMMDNTVVEEIDFTYAVNLNKISLYAFSDCENLKSVDVPASISNVGISIFRGCSGLERASFLANENKVPAETFMECTSLSEVTLSDEVYSIGDFAFADCTSLEYLELPASVSSIGNNAFNNDENLTLGVYYGSYAYQYAKDKNMSYVLLDGVKLGDTNGDGNVNIIDVTAIQRHLAQLNSLEGIYLYAADVNRNGSVDISDATALQMYLAQYACEVPIGEPMLT